MSARRACLRAAYKSDVATVWNQAGKSARAAGHVGTLVTKAKVDAGYKWPKNVSRPEKVQNGASRRFEFHTWMIAKGLRHKTFQMRMRAGVDAETYAERRAEANARAREAANTTAPVKP